MTLYTRALSAVPFSPSRASKETKNTVGPGSQFALPFPKEPQRPLSLKLHPSPHCPRTQGYFLLCTKSRIKALNLTRGALECKFFLWLIQPRFGSRQLIFHSSPQHVNNVTSDHMTSRVGADCLTGPVFSRKQYSDTAFKLLHFNVVGFLFLSQIGFCKGAQKN